MSRAKWDAAWAALKAEEHAYGRSSAEYDGACQDLDRECPDRAAEFDEYGLRYPRSREEALQTVVTTTTGKGSDASGPIMDEARRIVNDYFAWRERRKDAFGRFAQTAERKHDDAVDKRHEARKALLAAPAPDRPALLAKIEVFAELLDSDELDLLNMLYPDALRLLGGE